MKLHHVAFWTKDLERLVSFYMNNFSAKEQFRHSAGDFSCVFIRLFNEINIEIMTRPVLSDEDINERVGYSHLSIEVDSKKEVDRLTDYFVEKGVRIEKNKEQYDDGFYESSIRDPDGNIVEIAYVDRIVNPNV